MIEEIKFVRLNKNVILPKQQHSDDAGMDVFALRDTGIPAHSFCSVGLGLRCEFSNEYMLMVQERSGMAFNKGIFVLGKIIDAGYRGELHVGLANMSPMDYVIGDGDRIAQLILVKIGQPFIKEVDPIKLSETERGTNGEGSTGR